MKIRFGHFFLIALFLLSGCASVQQQPVAFAPGTLTPNTGRIGVAMTAVPKPNMDYPGAGCLLCLAAAAVANSSLSSYAHTLTAEDISSLKDIAADLLRKKGIETIVIKEDMDLSKLPRSSAKGMNVAMKDFTSLKQKYGIDKLLVINIDRVGFVRTYADYIPTSDPKGIVYGRSYLADLSSNTYDWYLPVNATKSSDSNWDEPPKFPGLTNAYYQAMEITKDHILRPLAEATAVSPAVASAATNPIPPQ